MLEFGLIESLLGKTLKHTKKTMNKLLKPAPIIANLYIGVAVAA